MNRLSELPWPTFFPADCPPLAAEPASGHAYRFVRNDPPKPEDFRSYRESGTSYEGDDCLACSLSILRDAEDVKHMRRSVPGFKKRRVALGELQTGAVKHTPGSSASHHSWWLPIGAAVAQDFAIVHMQEPPL